MPYYRSNWYDKYSKFARQFISALGAEGVIEPEGLVEEGDNREIIVLTEHLTSSEAEAVVKALEATLIAPIKIRGEIYYNEVFDSDQTLHVDASFFSARGGRRVTLGSWHVYIDEALRQFPPNPHFVAAELGKDATEGEEEFLQAFIARFIPLEGR